MLFTSLQLGLNKRVQFLCFVILSLLPWGLKGSHPIDCPSELLAMILQGISVWSVTAHMYTSRIKGLKAKNGNPNCLPRTRPEHHRKLLPLLGNRRVLWFLKHTYRLSPEHPRKWHGSSRAGTWKFPTVSPKLSPSLSRLTFCNLGQMPHCENKLCTFL